MTISKLQVAVLDDYQGVARRFADWSRVEARCQVSVFREAFEGEDALVGALAPFDVLCLMRERTPLSATVIERLPRLKLVVTTGAFNASVDGDALDRRGIVFCGTGANTHPTVELTWALILSLARNLPVELDAMKTGDWQRTVGRDLSGGVLGVVGLGKLGSHMARIGRAFGMEVIAWSQNLTPEAAAAAEVRYVDKRTLFGEADIVTLHVRLSERTRGIVGASELAVMKRDALLVNTSRGPLVDEAALIETLRAGRIGGAALDVYDIEPLPAHHPYRTLERLIATPHLGYVSEATYHRFYEDTVEDIEAWLDGRPLRVINSPRRNPDGLQTS